MCLGKKISGIILLLLINSVGIAQNHRQLSNWFCGDYSINKKENGISATVGESHIVNLSNIDSSNYWLVEDMSLNNLKRQRLLHVVLLDSGYIGVDIYNLKNGKSNNAITSFKQIKFDNYQKVNLSKLIFYYNRPSRGFEIFNDSNLFFYLDKYSLSVKCCSDFSNFYFDVVNIKSELLFKKSND
jgi:hypothetical protein